jgi:hypothetical protein
MKSSIAAGDFIVRKYEDDGWDVHRVLKVISLLSGTGMQVCYLQDPTYSFPRLIVSYRLATPKEIAYAAAKRLDGRK